MKQISLLIILLIPLIGTAQLKGEYLIDKTLIGVSGTISFEKDQSFKYHPNLDSRSLGNGNYVIHGDTLIMNFLPYFEPDWANCFSYDVTETNNSENSDSIKIKIEARDCLRDRAVPFNSVFIKEVQFKGSPLENGSFKIIGDSAGRSEITIPKSIEKIVLGVNAPEYEYLEIKINEIKGINLEVKANLYWDQMKTDNPGGIEKYQIIETNRNYLRLKLVESSVSEKSFICLRIRKYWRPKKIERMFEKYYEVRITVNKY